ncbi:bifunctional 3-oxoadipate enol-lactonase/4-carboxymuconolactone decarboxylase PcaDC [Wenjunlia tyrosinilytica]|uniref:3-oxoadipate enol-lactonase n=1 Tax=Wenjunlia tyrosinilytica TaxID=1544741 RepID=A0A917ZSG7_9ACTN|nr:4-carboxymuconolactone decarboxylase [Wenjunlia tyrosinilytica]GGO92582.1 3-oxoadipate enol-lactonase [Wenjunlia tyrosinilytica]
MTDVPLLNHRLDGPQDAPALVLGPALGTTSQIWQEQIADLSRYWRVVRYDLPGHGGSLAHPTHTVEEVAVLVLELLDRLGIEGFGYAGAGFGGSVGTLLALSHPHRVVSLALIGSSAGPGSPDAWREHALVVRATGLEHEARTAASRWFTPRSLAEEPALAEPCAHMVRTVDPACYAALCDALGEHDLRDQLPAVIAPTLVIAGAEDTTAPPGAARELIAGIPDSRLAVVPNAAHLANVEQPGPVTQLLLRHFAATLRQAPSPAAPPPPVEPAPAPPRAAADSEPVDYERNAFADGLKVRREVLGDAHVDRALSRADDLTGEFQEFITRYVWGEVWTRPGLDRRSRSIATITALVARGQLDELAFHIRAGVRNGLTRDEIREVLLQTAVYCGVPAANSAFAVAQRVLAED